MARHVPGIQLVSITESLLPRNCLMDNIAEMPVSPVLLLCLAWMSIGDKKA
jgi:hypothetical protein